MTDGPAAVAHLREAYDTVDRPGAARPRSRIDAQPHAGLRRRAARRPVRPRRGRRRCRPELVDERQGLLALERIGGYMHGLDPSEWRPRRARRSRATGSAPGCSPPTLAWEALIDGGDRRGGMRAGPVRARRRQPAARRHRPALGRRGVGPGARRGRHRATSGTTRWPTRTRAGRCSPRWRCTCGAATAVAPRRPARGAAVARARQRAERAVGRARRRRRLRRGVHGRDPARPRRRRAARGVRRRASRTSRAIGDGARLFGEAVGAAADRRGPARRGAGRARRAPRPADDVVNPVWRPWRSSARRSCAGLGRHRRGAAPDGRGARAGAALGRPGLSAGRCACAASSAAEGRRRCCARPSSCSAARGAARARPRRWRWPGSTATRRERGAAAARGPATRRRVRRRRRCGQVAAELARLGVPVPPRRAGRGVADHAERRIAACAAGGRRRPRDRPGAVPDARRRSSARSPTCAQRLGVAQPTRAGSRAAGAA